MQHGEMKVRLAVIATLLVGVAMIVGKSAYSAGIVQRNMSNSILDGGRPGPCHPHTDSPDYVAGTDVMGNPVAPADRQADLPMPAPNAILVPAHDGVVELDGKAIAPLMRPKPACPKLPASAH